MFQMASQYPPEMTEPMRQELVRLGVEDLRTADAVTAVLGEAKGSVLVVVNSVCGCAAGGARPAVAKALAHDNLPDRVVSVFAGVDREAVTQARAFLKGYNPSSPCIGLVKDGQVVFMLERGNIEGRSADQIAADLTDAFDRFCTAAA
jgi:putative YphP/YqiW family bacilliredoxin